jgi:hypothetical protein
VTVAAAHVPPWPSLSVELLVGTGGRVDLAPLLGHRPAPGQAIDGDGGPAVAVLAAEMDQQRVVVVLDAQTVLRAALLVQAAHGV